MKQKQSRTKRALSFLWTQRVTLLLLILIGMCYLNYTKDINQAREEGAVYGLQLSNQIVMQQLSEQGFVPIKVGSEVYHLVPQLANQESQ